VDADQLALGGAVVALVLAVLRAAVAQEVLGGADGLAGRQAFVAALRPLEAADHGRGVFGDDAGLLRIALVGAAPAVVADDGDGGGEGPVDARDAEFARGDLADAADQVRIARGAQADVVGEDGGPDDVVVPVHRVHAEQHGDGRAAGPRLDGDLVEGLRQVEPGLGGGAVVPARAGVAAGQHRAQRVLAQVLGLDRGDVALDGLADLLLQGHGGHQPGHLGLHGRVDQAGVARGGPERRVDLGGRGGGLVARRGAGGQGDRAGQGGGRRAETEGLHEGASRS